MSAMTIFSGTFCDKDSIVKELKGASEHQLVTDEEVVESASELSGIATEKIFRIIADKTSVFNKFTHEKERAIAYLRLAVAEKLQGKDIFIDGD